jgi:hypothetical protein
MSFSEQQVFIVRNPTQVEEQSRHAVFFNGFLSVLSARFHVLRPISAAFTLMATRQNPVRLAVVIVPKFKP